MMPETCHGILIHHIVTFPLHRIFVFYGPASAVLPQL